MASIEDALYTRLQAVTGVTDLVSTRIYPAKTENQNPTAPYVTYEILNTDRVSAFGSDSGDVTSEIRFHVWAQDTSSLSAYDSTRNVALEIRGALQRYRGTSATVAVGDIFIIQEFAAPEPEPTWAHRIIEVRAHWKE